MRRNATPASTTLEQPADGFVAPKLPGASSFLPATKRWYRTWCGSPQASQFTDTDWLRLHMLAPLVDEYYRRPSQTVLAEIRLNEAKLGATPEDRLRLRWNLPGENDDQAAEQARPSSRQRKDARLTLVKTA